MNAKTMTIVALIVVAIVGAGAYVALGNDSDDTSAIDTGGRLQVYGNVNNDDYLDDRDVTLLKDILSKNTDEDAENDVDWETEYSYADANADGVLDSSDVTHLEALVARTVGTTVYFVDGEGKDQEIDYPIDSICVLGTATFTASESLGLSEMIYGRSGTMSSKDVIFKDIWEKPAVSSNMISFDLSLFSNISDKVDGGIDAVIQNYAGMGKPIKEQNVVDELRDCGTSVITMKFDSKGEESSYLTLGFLCGVEEASHKIVGMMDRVYGVVEDAVADAGAKPTVLVPWITGGMGTGLYVTSNAPVAGPIGLAGGDVIQIPNGNMDISSGSVGILDEKYNGDYVVGLVRTDVSYLSELSDWEGPWERAVGKDSSLQHMDACPDHIYLIMYSLPHIVKMAYSVECLYPDQVEEGFGDSINQSWVDLCYSHNLGSDYSVKDHPFCVGSEDFSSSGGEDVPTESIAFGDDLVELIIGGTYVLNPVFEPEGSKPVGDIVWTSSNESVATVESGKVTAVSAGYSEVTLSIGELSAICTISVVSADYSKTAVDVGADAIAGRFAETYTDGVFGTYTVVEGADTQSATAEGAGMMGKSVCITFYGNSKASQMFEDSRSAPGFNEKLGMPGETMAEVDCSSCGFDGVICYKHEASGMATMTLLHFSAYVGDVFVDGYTSMQYCKGIHATDGDIQDLLSKISGAISE